LHSNLELVDLLKTLENLRTCSGFCSYSDKYVFTDINLEVVDNKGCFEVIANIVYEEWAKWYMFWMMFMGVLSIGNAGLVGLLFWNSTG
jgi:hypothetical protein